MTVEDPRLTHESAPKDDVRSTFFYHGVELPYSFSLTELTVVVNAHFSQTCLLRKLGKGAYHEVTPLPLIAQSTTHEKT